MWKLYSNKTIFLSELAGKNMSRTANMKVTLEEIESDSLKTVRHMEEKKTKMQAMGHPTEDQVSTEWW